VGELDMFRMNGKTVVLVGKCTPLPRLLALFPAREKWGIRLSQRLRREQA
jgi:hypothetical protein